MINNKYRLNTESLLTENFSPEINKFWLNHAQSDFFNSKHGGKIHTISIKTNQKNAVVICQGRAESVLKYKELAFDLHNQGYDVFLIDHRGQGFSDRLGGDKYRGHVQDFSHYVNDLKGYVDSLHLPVNYQSNFILAHSMGATICALYLQQQSHPFHAAALFSPMLSINLKPLPLFAVKAITNISDKTFNIFSDLPCYAWGTGAYANKPFIGNRLTSSKKRYQSVTNIFEATKQIQLGGPTMHWLNRSLLACNKAIKNAAKITIPVLVFEAGSDTIVSAQGQKKFFTNLGLCEKNDFMRIVGAKHEILIEQDKYRVPAINKMLDFFKQYQQGKS